MSQKDQLGLMQFVERTGCLQSTSAFAVYIFFRVSFNFAHYFQRNVIMITMVLRHCYFIVIFEVFYYFLFRHSNIAVKCRAYLNFRALDYHIRVHSM